MTDVLMACVTGTIALALVIDVAALLAFLWRNGSGR
jgi:hypothetical protein